MELLTFAGLDNNDRFIALASMTDAEIGKLAMAAERAADYARFTTRDSETTGRMGLVAMQARGETKRRMPAARPASRYTGCVAKVNGRWINW